jgi:hypothetical protein
VKNTFTFNVIKRASAQHQAFNEVVVIIGWAGVEPIQGGSAPVL